MSENGSEIKSNDMIRITHAEFEIFKKRFEALVYYFNTRRDTLVFREVKIRMLIFMNQHVFYKLKWFHAKSSTNSFAGLKEM